MLQLCSSTMFVPRGNPTAATGKCPAYITSGEKMDFTVSKFPSEDMAECGENHEMRPGVAGWD